MPAHTLAVAGKLAEEVAVAADHRLPEKVRDHVDDARLGHQIPHAAAVLVPVGELVAVPAGGKRLVNEVVEVLANGGDLATAEDVQRREVAVGVVVADLLDAEVLGVFHAQWDEAQIALELRVGVQVFVHAGSSGHASITDPNTTRAIVTGGARGTDPRPASGLDGRLLTWGLEPGCGGRRDCGRCPGRTCRCLPPSRPSRGSGRVRPS